METYKQKPALSSVSKQARWLWWGVLLALLLWVLTDLYVPRKTSIRQFDPAEVARLETAMWRSYYDKNPALLFWQLAGGLRQQFHAPFWRSVVLAFQATKAAFTFKQGKSRADYQETLPDLVAYYESIQSLTIEQFNISRVAEMELEWWIVHRQRDRYSYSDLSDALMQTSAALYNQPTRNFAIYGPLRADAMRLSDEAGRRDGGATEADWKQVDRVLNRAWGALQVTVQKGH
ncbi:hypothetical protein [Spirosoma luteum]|uniref:hypothetical protein n=1 Tax=Spirosoma luteum TaxID=431553 RepID=UPI00035D0B5F|nr:hypothetical protein [Spirosoma luteum]